jgi:AcrR family transcriptional regulator
MVISGQEPTPDRPPEKGPRARMQKIMRDTAIRLMQGGQVPSVSDVAEAAEVSRATAYRYFPSQASIIQAAVNEALGPILDWQSSSDDADERISDLLAFAYPRMISHEATHRAALRLALEQWARRHAGTLGAEARVVRGNRKALLTAAAKPLADKISKPAFDKLAQSLSLLFGVEAIIVLKDIWGLDGKEAQKVAAWAAHALVRAALSESLASDADHGMRGANQKAASRPRRRGKQARQ